MKKLISIVLPILNEEYHIPLLNQHMAKIFAVMPNYDYELIFVDDGSTDSSWKIIEGLAHGESQVKGLSLSRNFGQMPALKAGLHYAQGECVITLDADLQHPPELITQMIHKWEEGFAIVYAHRIKRNEERFSKRITAQLFNWAISLVSDNSMPNNVSDFRLMDRKVVEEVIKFEDERPFWRGIVAWSGFNYALVDYQCNARAHGTTRYGLNKLTERAIDALIGFSTLPIRLLGIFAGILLASSLGIFAYVLSEVIMRHTSLHLLIIASIGCNLFLMSFVFFALWLLSEYVSRIYNQQRKRPTYIIEKTANVNLSVVSHKNVTRELSEHHI